MKTKKGFTLVELLVVISIITLLAGLLIPVLDGALEAARRIHCMNNTRQLYIATVNYSSIIHGRVPPEVRDHISNELLMNQIRGDIFLAFELPYEIYRCPSHDYDYNKIVPYDPGPGNLTGRDGSRYDAGIKNFTSHYIYAGNYYRTEATGSYERDWTKRPTSFNNAKDAMKALWAEQVWNHRNDNEGFPAGANEAFIDGSVRWVKDFPILIANTFGNEDVSHWRGNPSAHWWW